MSAGAFVSSKYESNAGNIYAIRVQPETLAMNVGAVNAAPAGDIDTEGRLAIRKNRRAFGVVPRTVSLRFTGAVPDGYKSGDAIQRVVVMTPSVFNDITIGDTGTYLGSSVEVVGKTSEGVN